MKPKSFLRLARFAGALELFRSMENPPLQAVLMAPDMAPRSRVARWAPVPNWRACVGIRGTDTAIRNPMVSGQRLRLLRKYGQS